MKFFSKISRGPASTRRLRRGGFTIVEILVSVAIFATVMTVSLGALLSMSESNRRVETLKSVINNLNFALDDMSRSIRTGMTYHCGATGTLTATQDCASAQTYFTYKASGGTQVAYCLDSSHIKREIVAGGSSPDASCAAANFLSITAPEVVITTLNFFTVGAQSATLQPKVTILISGYVVVAGAGTCGTTATCSAFNLQTSVTQRIYDQ